MADIKREFLLDPSVIFLNHGSFGATPVVVFDEYQRWQRELERQPVEFLGRRVTELLRESRSALGEYLGTAADNLVYVQNVTIALNVVANSLDLRDGDEVLTTDHEYGAMDRMWRYMSKARGFRYLNHPLQLPFTTEQKLIDDFWTGVTKNTRVIFISHITSATAIIFPVREIIRRAREAGILTIIDGAHVPGQIPLHLDSLGADFYGGNLHKWLCAPKGAGFLYARPEVQSLLRPLVVSWGYEAEIPGPSKFIDHHEWWGTRDVSAFLSVPTAIQFQKDHEWDRIRIVCHEIATYAHEKISALTGLEPLHPLTSNWFAQMTALPLPDVDVTELKEQLIRDFSIEVPVYEWNGRKLIRVSVQGYNTKREIDLLVEALSRLL